MLSVYSKNEMQTTYKWCLMKFSYFNGLQFVFQ